MVAMTELPSRVLFDVLATLGRVWPFLVASVLIAAAMPVYVGLDRLARQLRRRWWVAVVGAVALATLTPFCSCGTTAVLLGMMASAVPWAPLVAFMVSSPLTSPSELVVSAGLLGWPFALVFFAGTIVLGLVAGIVAHVIERAGWLEGQARVRSTGTCNVSPVARPAIRPVGAAVATMPRRHRVAARLRLDAYGREIWRVARRLVPFFLAYTAVGYLVVESIPTEWLVDHAGGDSPWAVPLAALLGVPAYVNTEGSLPLVAALVDGGMGRGPALAFVVTGAGTSIGAISGLFVIARRRVVALVIGLLFAGALALGWIGQLVW